MRRVGRGDVVRVVEDDEEFLVVDDLVGSSGEGGVGRGGEVLVNGGEEGDGAKDDSWVGKVGREGGRKSDAIELFLSLSSRERT